VALELGHAVPAPQELGRLDREQITCSVLRSSRLLAANGTM
jgi:hypothetical protein